DPIEDIKTINAELAAYDPNLAKKPQIIAANKTDVMLPEEAEAAVNKLREAFKEEGYPIYSISAVSGKGVKELLYAAAKMLAETKEDPIVFEREFSLDNLTLPNEPYTVEYDEKDKMYVVEGPRIEKMLGYTNIDSEKGFEFFQNFLKNNGILEELEAMGIQDGDTVRMYGLQFDYYK
ncbi:MAG: Obg family GTPase CgtA, partial [Lachnospiraceae bacterium]|nr:Obg family GTPase CgtA [Lachnospiraceae bacterium]